MVEPMERDNPPLVASAGDTSVLLGRAMSGQWSGSPGARLVALENKVPGSAGQAERR
jgi:hypothetical protein